MMIVRCCDLMRAAVRPLQRAYTSWFEHTTARALAPAEGALASYLQAVVSQLRGGPGAD